MVAAYQQQSQLYRTQFRALGCRAEVQAYTHTASIAGALFTRCQDRIAGFEHKYSRYLPDSLVSTINACAGKKAVPIDTETVKLLRIAERLYHTSNQRFTILAGVFRRAWSFGRNTIPSQAEIDRLLPLTRWDHLEWNDTTCYLRTPGMEIDFGGFGKEYAVDLLLDLMIEDSGVFAGLINLGGDIATFGTPPGRSHWDIGIAHPDHPHIACVTLPLAHGCIATSGDYERGFVVNGRRYHHLIDATTGHPVQGGLRAATVHSSSCLTAGALATLAMLLPEQEGLALLEARECKYLAIDQELICTQKW